MVNWPGLGVSTAEPPVWNFFSSFTPSSPFNLNLLPPCHHLVLFLSSLGYYFLLLYLILCFLAAGIILELLFSKGISQRLLVEFFSSLPVLFCRLLSYNPRLLRLRRAISAFNSNSVSFLFI